MKFNSEIKTANIALTIGIFILLSLGFLSYNVFQSSLDKESRTAHTYQVLQTSKEFLSNIKDAETGQRGYIITVNDSFLAPYNYSVKHNAILFAKLNRLIGNNPIQQKRCDTLKKLSFEKYAILKKGISIRNEFGATAAVVEIKKGNGKRVMDEIRRIFLNLDNEEQYLLLKGENDSNRTQILIKRIIFSGIVSGIITFIIIYLIFRRQISRREKNEEELFIRKEWFTQTLASLCDGVISTDTKGTITMINRAASEILGWSPEEAVNKHIDTIFVISNEDSGAKMISPTVKALKTDHIVLLSNHTVLRRKDGVILFIDDSGAPIHNQESEIIGAILIFRDITEKKIAEQLVVDSNIRFTKIFDLSPVAICIAGLADEKMMYVNDAFCQILKFNREDLIGKKAVDLQISEKALRKNIDTHVKTNIGPLHGVEITLRKSNSEVIEVLSSLEVIEIDNKMCLMSSFIDITDRKIIEKKIITLHHALENKNKELLDSIHYAKRIQVALITSESYIERNLNRLIK